MRGNQRTQYDKLGFMSIFEIEDDVHAEGFGQFDTYEQAFERLKEIAEQPWDKEPYKPPCSGWEDCDREYHIVEWDNTEPEWKEISRKFLLYVSANSKQWKDEIIDVGE